MTFRIVGRKTKKIGNIFQHTKPIFFKLKVLTVSNLYYYSTANSAARILCTEIPKLIYNLFEVSDRTHRLILPKFNRSSVKTNSFIFNSSKILNYLLQHDIPYHILPLSIFKKRLKRHLQATQNLSVNGDDSWLPCNHDLFSNVTV